MALKQDGAHLVFCPKSESNKTEDIVWVLSGSPIPKYWSSIPPASHEAWFCLVFRHWIEKKKKKKSGAILMSKWQAKSRKCGQTKVSQNFSILSTGLQQLIYRTHCKMTESRIPLLITIVPFFNPESRFSEIASSPGQFALLERTAIGEFSRQASKSPKQLRTSKLTGGPSII